MGLNHFERYAMVLIEQLGGFHIVIESRDGIEYLIKIEDCEEMGSDVWGKGRSCFFPQNGRGLEGGVGLGQILVPWVVPPRVGLSRGGGNGRVVLGWWSSFTNATFGSFSSVQSIVGL